MNQPKWKSHYNNIKITTKKSHLQIFTLNYKRFEDNDIKFIFFQYKFATTKHAFYSFIFGQALYYTKLKLCSNNQTKLIEVLNKLSIKISRIEIYRLINLYLNLGHYKKMYHCQKTSYLKRYSSQISQYLITHPKEAKYWK